MAEKRSAFLLFINTTPSAEASYALVGEGVTELSRLPLRAEEKGRLGRCVWSWYRS